MNVIVKENMDAACMCYVQGLGAVLHRPGDPEQTEFERRKPKHILRKTHTCSGSAVVAAHAGMG